jgi:predicted O-methyltransferase YrrM
VDGASERRATDDRDLRRAEAVWGSCGPRSLVELSDFWRIAGRLPLALKLAGAAVRDPGAFRIAAVAVRRHRALQKPLELYEYVRFLRGRRIDRCLEIGTLWGGSLFAHCAVTGPDGHVIAVDSFPQENAAAMTSRCRRLARARQQVTCIWGDSHAESTVAEVAAALKGNLLDLLFLDGDHSEEGVARDYELYSPLVRPRGLIAFHDVAAPAGRGVPHLWRSLQRDHESVEFVDRVHTPHGLGIGVLVKG